MLQDFKEYAVTLNYGLFVNSIVVFLIVAFSVFLLVRALMKAKRKEEEHPAEETA